MALTRNEVMKTMRFMLVLIALGTLSSCAGVDWDARIGSYTYDDAVREYGPPDSEAKLDDGTTIAAWEIQRARNWANFLNMEFDKSLVLRRAYERRR